MPAYFAIVSVLLLASTLVKLFWLSNPGELPARQRHHEALDVVVQGMLVAWGVYLLINRF